MALKQKLSITWDQTNCSISSGDNWLSISCQYKKLPTVRLRGAAELAILDQALADALKYKNYTIDHRDDQSNNPQKGLAYCEVNEQVSFRREADRLILCFDKGHYVISDNNLFDLWVWRQFLIAPKPPSYQELCSYDDLEQLDVSIVNNYWLLIGGGNCFVERLVSHKDARQFQKELLTLAGMKYHASIAIRQVETGAQLTLTPTGKGCRIGDIDTTKPAYADLLRSSMVRFAVAIGDALEIAQPA